MQATRISLNTVLIWVWISISSFFFLMANLFQSPECCVFYLCFFCMAMVFFCVNNFAQKMGLAFFYLCFFTFLISGAVIPFFRDISKWKMGFNDKDYIIACNCLFLSSLFMLCGYVAIGKVSLKVNNRSRGRALFRWVEDTNYSVALIRKISLFIFITTTIGVIPFEYRKLLYAVKNGYMSLYTTYSSSAWGTRLSVASMSSFFLVLATRPNKRKTILVFCLGVIPPLLQLAEGSRGDFVSYGLFIVFYLYQFSEFNLEKVLTQKERRKKFIKFIALMLLIAVIALPWLHNYGYSRAGLRYEEASGVINKILDFFVGQGGSFRLVGYASQFKGQLHNACYSFGGLWGTVIGKGYAAQTVENALFGTSFGDAVTYKVHPTMYLNGYGMGSSYVAELYYDFGYVGVCIVNFFIGAFLRKLAQLNKKNVLQIAIMLSLFYYMTRMPRGSLSRSLGYLISRTNIAVWGVAFCLSRKRTGIEYRRG